MFNIDMDSKISLNISQLSVSSMNDNQIAIVNNLKTLSSVKGESHFINGFTTTQIRIILLNY